MRSSSSRISMNPSPMGFKSSIDASVQSGNSSSNDIQKVRGNDVSDQRMVVSAKYKIFVPKTTICQYRPRNLGGSRIKSAALRTKPRPQWCPKGLTHTKKWRVQQQWRIFRSHNEGFLWKKELGVFSSLSQKKKHVHTLHLRTGFYWPIDTSWMLVCCHGRTIWHIKTWVLL
jgi:hypothetical protein